MSDLIKQITEAVAAYTPNLVAALAVLVAGWLVAWMAAFVLRKLLERTSIDNKLADWVAGGGKKVPVEIYASRAVYYLLMLFVLAAFLHTLKLTVLTEPLQNMLGSVLNYLPRLLAGGVLGLVAWGLAVIVRRLIAGVLSSAKVDERIGQAAGREGEPPPGLGKPIAEAAYWVVLLVFLPAILGALGIEALVEPVNTMLNKFFGFLPNLVAAGVTLAAGWFVARIVQRLVSSLLASAGADNVGQQWNLSPALGRFKLSEVVGLAAYALILLPVIIAALDELRLDAVTKPASDMLGVLLTKIPVLFGVALILFIAWMVGRVVSALATNLLRGCGFDGVLMKTGLTQKVPEGPMSPSAIAGWLLQIGVMLLAAMAAAETLGFSQVATVMNDFLHFAGQVVLGLLLFGLGLLLAQVVANAISAGGSPKARLLAQVTRWSISVLIGAMALRATGVAESIVNLAFGALVCGLAAAAALAFGLGGRRFAADQLEKWKSEFAKKTSEPKPPSV